MFTTEWWRVLLSFNICYNNNQSTGRQRRAFLGKGVHSILHDMWHVLFLIHRDRVNKQWSLNAFEEQAKRCEHILPLKNIPECTVTLSGFTGKRTTLLNDEVIHGGEVRNGLKKQACRDTTAAQTKLLVEKCVWTFCVWEMFTCSQDKGQTCYYNSFYSCCARHVLITLQQIYWTY